MKKTGLLCIVVLLYNVQVQLRAAASSHAASASSSYTFSKETSLMSSDCERLRAANARVDKMGISMIDINYLINANTDFWLSDPIAQRHLKHIKRKFHENMMQQDPNYKEGYSNTPTQTHTELLSLVDSATKGTLPDRITPYTFIEFLRICEENQHQEISLLPHRTRAIISIVLAAANRNLKENPTYAMIRYDERQNEFLRTSETFLVEYYAQLNRPRLGAVTPTPKKTGSKLQRLLHRNAV